MLIIIKYIVVIKKLEVNLKLFLINKESNYKHLIINHNLIIKLNKINHLVKNKDIKLSIVISNY
jgi:hypothetical protein